MPEKHDEKKEEKKPATHATPATKDTVHKAAASTAPKAADAKIAPASTAPKAADAKAASPPAGTRTAPAAPGKRDKASAPAKAAGKKEQKDGAGKAPEKGKTTEKYKASQKPELSAAIKRAMKLRARLKDRTPYFIRQETYNYIRLGEKWRRPRGTHSKLRHHFKARINVVSIGYGGPNASKGLHPSGFREVLVHHPLELDKMDPKTQAARIAHGVGTRKRKMIEMRADRMGIRILNKIRKT